MKRFTYLLPLLPVLFLVFGFLKVNQIDPNADVSPALNSEIVTGNETDTIRPPGFPYPTQWNFYCGNVPNLNAGTVGAMYLFGKYYINRWNLAQAYILDSTGPNGGPSTVGMRTFTYTGSVRDLTTDGRYIYGGKASSILYKMDTNWALVNQFSLTGIIRAITWDPNRKGFWYADWTTPITCRDTNNVLKGTITTTFAAKYGLGFDSTSSPDSAFIYLWDQGSGTINHLVRFYISGPTPIQLNDWSFTVVGLPNGIAGGAEVVRYPDPPRMMLLLNYQNVALVGYMIKDLLVGLEKQNGLVRDYTLSQNYPNPFNPTTTISYTLSKANYVNLIVYDATGSLVKTLVNNYQQAGEHRLSFDATGLASGIYFYTISVNDFTASKKMLLVK